MGQFQKAIEYYEKTEPIWLRIHGANHPRIAKLYHNFGVAYANLKDYSKAYEYHHKALTLRKALFEFTHPDVVESMEELRKLEEKK